MVAAWCAGWGDLLLLLYRAEGSSEYCGDLIVEAVSHPCVQC